MTRHLAYLLHLDGTYSHAFQECLINCSSGRFVFCPFSSSYFLSLSQTGSTPWGTAWNWRLASYLRGLQKPKNFKTGCQNYPCILAGEYLKMLPTGASREAFVLYCCLKLKGLCSNIRVAMLNFIFAQFRLCTSTWFDFVYLCIQWY